MKYNTLELVIAGLLLCCTSLYAQEASTAAGKTTELTPAQTKCHDPIQILSNTMGVDFKQYTKQIVKNVQKHWYEVIPQVARPPASKKGVVALEFAIEKDGQVKGSQIVAGSGDVSLDRAAWTGFTASTPFPPLPSKFEGEYVAVRVCFFYNPDKPGVGSQ
jgi:TonB family protein